MTETKRKRKYRILKTACLLLAAFLAYHIIGGYLPFARHPRLEDPQALEVLADEIQRDVDTPDRAMLLSTGEDALDERIRLMNQAREEIVVAAYDLRDGESTRDALCVALDRADDGVRVRLLADGIAGLRFLSGNAVFQALEAHPNIEIRFYNPPRLFDPRHNMGRMHDKYIIIDDLAYILGGRNMFDAFIGNYPVDLRKDDREALVYNGAHGASEESSSIYQVWDYFDSVWDGEACAPFTGQGMDDARRDGVLNELRARFDTLRQERPGLFGEADYPARTVPTKGVWLVSNPTTPYAKQPVVFSQLCALMERAKTGIFIQSPYAVLDEGMAGRLIAIVKKTPLTLMVNAVERSHNIVASGDYMFHRNGVQALRATLLEYAGDSYHHSKAVCIDDCLSVIGCYNLDLRSTYVDTELMLVVRGQEFNALLRHDLDALAECCRRVNGSDVTVPEGLHIPHMPLLKRIALWVVGALVQPVRNLV